jgi:hypothetical protein
MSFFLISLLLVDLQDSSKMEVEAMAIQLYLEDLLDHDKHCPQIEWEQPDIEVYKETLVSHLPEGCVPQEETQEPEGESDENQQG